MEVAVVSRASCPQNIGSAAFAIFFNPGFLSICLVGIVGLIAVNVRLVGIPANIMTHYRHLTLGGGVMFVNKRPFFMSISRQIRFGTGEMIQNQKSATILAAIKQIKSIYMKRGFKLDHMLMDGQFEPLWAELADISITLNTIWNDEHVSEIKRNIRTTKERARCVYNTLPL
jgi:hypothetical protein